MTHQNEARHAGGAAGLGNVDLRAANDTRDTIESQPLIQVPPHDIERFMRREEVHEAAAEAMNYLGAIMHFVAADDVPGLRYSYAKFAAYGRVVALVQGAYRARRRCAMTGQASSAVYDGQSFAGSISKLASGFAAFDRDEKTLGIFPTQIEAVRAVFKAAKGASR